ncbi:MAG: winged helix DNA-binding domain-containing protein [Chloroflexota bacterium]|nr:winged helix DNA-binding domain-containing protein [Chloroflexota bacterium]
MTRQLDLTRAQILASRRRTQALDERLAPGPRSLRRAAWAGLQDSVPRAALLSIHARVEGTQSSTWEDPSLVQLWGPRFTAYVVPALDLTAFSLGRLPDDVKGRRRAEDLAARLHAFLGGRRMSYGEAGRGLGVHPNQLRYAAATGTVLIRWDGARLPTVWTVPAHEVDPLAARLQLARRYLRVFGPSRPSAFARWAGIAMKGARVTFDELGPSLTPVRTPIGDGWILSEDERTFREPAGSTDAARLLPSGDPYFLLHGADRELLVPEAGGRAALWTPRVWPGAVLVAGEIVGTWRRADAALTIQSWRRLSRKERDEVEAEAQSMPLPDIGARVTFGVPI